MRRRKKTKGRSALIRSSNNGRQEVEWMGREWASSTTTLHYNAQQWSWFYNSCIISFLFVTTVSCCDNNRDINSWSCMLAFRYRDLIDNNWDVSTTSDWQMFEENANTVMQQNASLTYTNSTISKRVSVEDYKNSNFDFHIYTHKPPLWTA